MSDLGTPELIALGESFFKLEQEKAQTKAIVEGTGVPKTKDYSVTNDSESLKRVLKAIVAMYLKSQQLVKVFAKNEGHILNITPAQFLIMFKTYQKLLRERKVIVHEIQMRYAEGLEKLRNAQDAIYKYHQQLDARSPELMEQVITVIINT